MGGGEGCPGRLSLSVGEANPILLVLDVTTGSSGNSSGCDSLSPPCYLIVAGMTLCGFYPPSTECTALPSVDSQTELRGRCEAVRAVRNNKIPVVRGWRRLRGL